MHFSSYAFLFVFLPVVFAGYLALAATSSRRAVVMWLVASSVAFYAYWNFKYVAMLAASIGVNYLLGGRIRALSSAESNAGAKKFLALGILLNLSLLGYYKYTGFFVSSLNEVFGASFTVPHILLPLAISFFTFQQIAYLIDQYRSPQKVGGFLEYAAFVLFFPHLIAGPIVNHGEMIPQFADDSIRRASVRNLAIGLTIFGLGLFKKVMLADRIGVFVGPVFDAADRGTAPSFVEAWGGALSYTFQLYFDFSGYSDMAIGLGCMFGVRLPVNFDSPYKATNIIDFWRRWHMTLTRFLTGYLYNPLLLRLTRARAARRGRAVSRGSMGALDFLVLIAWPTMVTMTLAGIWHGAGYTFVLFGALHGAYLVVNHAWRAFRRRRSSGSRVGRLAGWALMFGAVVVSWVIFRAKTLSGAGAILAGMIGANGVALPTSYLAHLDRLGLGSLFTRVGVEFRRVYLFEGAEQFVPILMMLAMVTLGPNVQEMVRLDPPQPPTGPETEEPNPWRWRPSLGWSIAVGVLFALSVSSLTRVSEFLYFQF